MTFSDERESGHGLVAVTNLFPNQFEPRRGLFNFQQFKALARLVRLHTVAPVAYFPLGALLKRFASSGRVDRLPERGRFGGLDVSYPRYFYPPLVGRPVQGQLYRRGARRAVAAAREEVGANVLYGTWAYPDGFAVTRMADELGLPCVIKVHGSDINDYIETGWRRRVIVDTLNRASKVVSVSHALKERMVEHGVSESKIVVVYNGVDGEVFKPQNRAEAANRLGLEQGGKRLLFVGNLKPVKGLDTLIEAVRLLIARGSDVRLHIVGFGVLESALKEQARAAGVQGRVHFEGEKSPDEIARWMNACDVLCLPSVNEGVPNVVLEATACGLPSVASRVGGIPEVIASGTTGLLSEPRDAESVAATVARALEHDWVPSVISQHATQYSWDSNAASVLSAIRSVV